jgi:hypothetical protein
MKLSVGTGRQNCTHRHISYDAIVSSSRSDDVSVAYGKPQIEADHCLEQPDCELDDLLRIFRFDLRMFVDELVPEVTGARSAWDQSSDPVSACFKTAKHSARLILSARSPAWVMSRATSAQTMLITEAEPSDEVVM